MATKFVQLGEGGVMDELIKRYTTTWDRNWSPGNKAKRHWTEKHLCHTYIIWLLFFSSEGPVDFIGFLQTYKRVSNLKMMSIGKTEVKIWDSYALTTIRIFLLHLFRHKFKKIKTNFKTLNSEFKNINTKVKYGKTKFKIKKKWRAT